MKKTERYIYPAIFTYEDNCEIAVNFPDLEVATSGKDENDALFSARELLGVVMMGLEEDTVPIPTPSHLSELSLQSNQKSVLVDVYMHPSGKHE